MLYLFIFLPAFIILMVFLIVLIKSPPQAKAFMKAKFLKRGTLVLSSEDGTLDVVAPKVNKTGHQEVSKGEVYQPLKGTNPVISDRFFWRKTGIPVFVAAGRKAVYTSPQALTAIKVVEGDKKALPKHIREWAEKTKIPIETTSKEGEKTVEMRSLLKVNPNQLKDYLDNAIDIDAENILYDQAFNEGYESAGKPPKIFYALVGCGFAVFMVILGLLMAGML